MLALVAIVLGSVNAQVTYDAEFWEGFEDDGKPFEHNWLDVPDFVNMTDIEWYFNITHHFLQGIERGMYKNDSLVLSEDCFGPRFIIKINEFAAMTKKNVGDNIVMMMMIIYQMYYMWGEKCKIDETFNDVYLFCWNDGCTPDQVGKNIEKNILYMTRDIIDAAIVWWEGVPAERSQQQSQWHRLSSQTGETFAGIVKEFTNFVPQTTFKVRDE